MRVFLESSKYFSLVFLLTLIGHINEVTFANSDGDFKGSSLARYDSKVIKLKLSNSTPEGVGTLLTLDKRGPDSGACTWFLISEDMAMTNSHCIPKLLKTNNNLNCGEYLQGRFSTGVESALAKCRKLLFFSDISKGTKKNNDYALIKLDRSYSNINFLPFSRDGLFEDEVIKVLAMNSSYVGLNIFSKYREHTCVIKSSDKLGVLNFSGDSPIAGFKKRGDSSSYCNVIIGNSGAPVINSRGEVVGIVHGSVNAFKVRPRGNFMTTEASIITNFRCRPLPGFDSNLPGECAYKNNTKKDVDPSIDVRKKQKIIEKLAVKEVFEMQPQVFKYKFRLLREGLSYNITFIPICIVPLSKWSSNDVDQIIEDKKWFRKSTQHLLTSVESFNISSDSIVDYYGNFRVDKKVSVNSVVKYKINDLDSFEEHGSSFIDVDYSDSSSERIHLNVCQN